MQTFLFILRERVAHWSVLRASFCTHGLFLTGLGAILGTRDKTLMVFMPHLLSQGLGAKYRLPLCCFLSVILQSSSNTEPAQHISLGELLLCMYHLPTLSQMSGSGGGEGVPISVLYPLGYGISMYRHGSCDYKSDPRFDPVQPPSLELLGCPQKSPSPVGLCTELSSIQLGCQLVSSRVFPGSMKFWKGLQEKCKIETGLILEYLKTIQY